MAKPRQSSSLSRGFENQDPLTALSPLDGRYFSETKELREYGSELAVMSFRLEVEAMYLIQLSDARIIKRRLTSKERKTLVDLGPNLTLNDGKRIKEIEVSPGGTDHDMKSIEVFMAEKFKGTSFSDLIPFIHILETSEDTENLAFRLGIKRAADNILIPRALSVAENLLQKAEEYKSLPIMGRTHGQDALPVTFGHEFAYHAEKLLEQAEKVKNTKLKGKFNGAVGLFSAHTAAYPDVNWQAFSKKFVDSFGFEYKQTTTQTNPYEDVLELIQNVQRMGNVVHNMDQDMWRYISDDWLAQEVIATATGSSTMSQKVNPIKFENSEGHFEISSGNTNIFVDRLAESRLQRDLSDSALRRYILPNVFGAALIAYSNALRGLESVYPDTDVINEALMSNWGVMAEWAQISLRKARIESAYEIIKAKTRGVKIKTQAEWSEIVSSLDIADSLKKKILSQNPATYTGQAAKLVDESIVYCRSILSKIA